MHTSMLPTTFIMPALSSVLPTTTCLSVQNASTAEGLGAPGNEGDEAVLRVLASTGDSEGVSRPGAKAQPSGPDIVSMLAHVFGTGELFVAEYRWVAWGWGDYQGLAPLVLPLSFTLASRGHARSRDHEGKLCHCLTEGSEGACI